MITAGLASCSSVLHKLRGSRETCQRTAESDLETRHPNVGILQDRYDLVRPLARGNFGSVKLVQERRSGRLFALKQVDRKSVDPSSFRTLTREARILSKLDHPFIVQLIEFADVPIKGQLSIVMDYIDGCDAQQLRQKSGGHLEEPLVATLAIQLLAALAHCHSVQVVHRDVKPENILIAKSAEDCVLQCKLIDFGCAKEKRCMSRPVGTPSYMAPEVVDRWAKYTSQADMWSCGSSLLLLLTGRLPFGNALEHAGRLDRLMERVKAYRLQDFSVLEPALETTPWSHLSFSAQKFVRRLLEPLPVHRPSAMEAAASEWLGQYPLQGGELTKETLQSIVAYAKLPHILRCCLVLNAPWENAKFAESGAIFVTIDSNKDGVLSFRELDCAMDRASAELHIVKPAVRGIFDAMNVSGSGSISFTEFLVACSYAGHGSDEELLLRTFETLDIDRDGLVRGRDIPFMLSRGCDVHLFSHEQLVCPSEWLQTLASESRHNNDSPPRKRGACGYEEDLLQLIMKLEPDMGLDSGGPVL